MRFVQCRNAADQLSVAANVAKALASASAGGHGPHLDGDPPPCPGEIAILTRTNSALTMTEKAMLKAGVAYQIVGGTSYWMRKEVKDVLAYVKLALDPEDEISLGRIINEPSRGLGDKTLEAIKNLSKVRWRVRWGVRFVTSPHQTRAGMRATLDPRDLWAVSGQCLRNATPCGTDRSGSRDASARQPDIYGEVIASIPHVTWRPHCHLQSNMSCPSQLSWSQTRGQRQKRLVPAVTGGFLEAINRENVMEEARGLVARWEREGYPDHKQVVEVKEGEEEALKEAISAPEDSAVVLGLGKIFDRLRSEGSLPDVPGLSKVGNGRAVVGMSGGFRWREWGRVWASGSGGGVDAMDSFVDTCLPSDMALGNGLRSHGVAGERQVPRLPLLHPKKRDLLALLAESIQGPRRPPPQDILLGAVAARAARAGHKPRRKRFRGGQGLRLVSFFFFSSRSLSFPTRLTPSFQCTTSTRSLQRTDVNGNPGRGLPHEHGEREHLEGCERPVEDGDEDGKRHGNALQHRCVRQGAQCVV